ncbi:hypothetical protein ACFV0B_07210 [Streptomyces xanthophaeus]|uniref:hypothetical protein n=1 Tax=Streptomyces xanthophaeus TaxID=67385 RepID=UPI0036A89492
MATAGGADQGGAQAREQEPEQEPEQTWAQTEARVRERLQAQYEAPADPDVHALQRAMAGVALLLGALATGWSLGVGTTGAFVFPFLALMAPVLVRNRVGFRRICLWLAVVLIPAGVVLYLVGMFLLIPSAVLLLLARGADPRRSPSGAWVRAGCASLIALSTAVMTLYGIVAVASSG